VGTEQIITIYAFIVGGVVMKVPTQTPVVVVENAAKPTEGLRMLLAYILAIAQPKPPQATRRKKHVKAPRTGHKELQPTGSCVILVESDIKQDLHGIMP
jgi:hypothetical protein